MPRTDFNVLVVDDDFGIRRALQERLSAAGFGVTTVPTGEEAVGLCTGTPPDAVILDVKLPGADGYQTCEQIRAVVDAPELAVIFLTGVRHAGTESGLDQLVNRAGGDYFLCKPYDPHLLIRLLDRIEAEKSAAAGSAELTEASTSRRTAGNRLGPVPGGEATE
jgi:DNA-binding response OmpR family regulator